MQTTEIYIICTYYKGGRYVQTATTDRARADAEAARVIAGYTADGWELEQTQKIAPGEYGEGPGDPSTIEVFHLRHKDGDFCNVELYQVEDINEN